MILCNVLTGPRRRLVARDGRVLVAMPLAVRRIAEGAVLGITRWSQLDHRTG